MMEMDTVTPLMEFLNDPDTELRIYAALALGEMHDAESIPALLEALEDPDPNVRYHAVEALGKLRAADAVEALCSIVESRDFFLAFPALDALMRIGRPGICPRVVPLLKDDRLREPTAELLGKLGDQDVVEPLVSLLNEPGAPVHVIARALIALSNRYEKLYGEGAYITDLVKRSVDKTATVNLIEALKDANDDQLRSFVAVLGWLEDPEVGHALVRQLGQPAVKKEVVEAGSPFIEVVGAAHDGEEALDLVEKLRPDVVVLDLIMPRMDGVEFLKRQMKRRPIPVVVSVESGTGEMVLAALDAGAIDFIQKPTALATEKIYEIGDELISKVKSAARASISYLKPFPAEGHTFEKRSLPAVRSGRVDMVVIGISIGGPQALKFLIPQFPADFPVPMAAVLHMPIGYTQMYAQKLNEVSMIEVTEACEGDLVRPGAMLLAPAGRHLSFYRREDGEVVAHLDARPFDTQHRPSVDVLFQSAGEVYKDRVLGVVMTGMGSDGKRGTAWIKSQGGLVYVESEETCVVYGMPRSVFEAGLSDRVVPLDEMARAIMEAVWSMSSGGGSDGNLLLL